MSRFSWIQYCTAPRLVPLKSLAGGALGTIVERRVAALNNGGRDRD